MTRATAVAVVVAALASGLVGGLAGPAAGLGTGVAAGVLAVLVGGEASRRSIRRLSGQLAAWLEPDHEDHQVVVTGNRDWRELGSILNQLGTVHGQYRRQAGHELPWRSELVDSLASAALLFDADGHLQACNRAAEELLGIEAGGRRRTAIQALGSAVLADAVGRARAEGGHVEVDADLGERQVGASVAAVGDETLVIVHDRTRERRVEELRRNFVVNASHELKTPATSIHTLAEALEITAERDPARVPDLVARLREEAERLVRLVHDLLNLRRLEEGGDLERAAIDLVWLSRDVIAELDDRARERHVDVALDSPDEAWVSGDPDDVRLIIRNLVANAIQYNREGGRVDVRVRPSSGAWVVEVADTGIGIPQQDIQRIFERFYRVDVARSRETGGTGLGLSIVRHAVERHGGSIRVESLLGEGSTFSVTLPTTGERAT